MNNTISVARERIVNDYWANKLLGKNQGFSFTDNTHTKSIELQLEKPTHDKLMQMTKGNEKALFTVLLCFYQQLLKVYFPDSELVVSGQNLFFSKSFIDENSIKEAITATKDEVLQAEKYSDGIIGSSEQINQVVKPAYHIFQLTINQQTTETYGITLNVELGDTITLSLIYNSLFFTDFQALQFAKHLAEVFKAINQSLDNKIGEVRLISEQEYRELIIEKNTTNAHLAPDLNIINVFEYQVLNTPNAVALVFEGNSLSYNQLNQKVNAVANNLVAMGLPKNQAVGVLLNRSELSVIAILAIIKAGGVYLFLDSELPQNRLSFIIDSAQPFVILSEVALFNKVQELNCANKVRHISDLQTGSIENPCIKINHNDYSYFIFTSGSTGTPKGVLQTHSTLINLMEWQRQESGIETQQRYLQYASFGFDVSLQDVFFALCYGGSLHVLSQDKKLDLVAIRKYISEHAIQTIYMPCSILNNLFDAELGNSLATNSLENIITAGEQLLIGTHLYNFLKENPSVKLHNHYGPSETHVVTAFQVAGKDEFIPTKVPIGKPVSNTQVFILDTNQQLTPKGLIGEVYIGGANLAVGYYGREDLTDEKFIEYQLGNEVIRLYSTGDLGRWLADGSLEYMGRTDHQVKIRGFRIELDEIEQSLLKVKTIEEAIVSVKENQGEKYIVAYYTSKKHLVSADIKQDLAQVLPQYMLPDFFIKVEKFVLNVNGKINKQLLPEPNFIPENTVDESKKPHTTEEILIAKIWSEVLGKEVVDVEANFFDLGGHSLKATRMIAKFYTEFGVNINFRDFFNTPTIQFLAQFISKNQPQKSIQIPIAPTQEHYPLSHAQYRLWMQEQQSDNHALYNIPFVCKLKGAVNIDALEKAFNSIINRHEVLRTTFHIIEGVPHQRIHDYSNVTLKIEQTDWRFQNQDLLNNYVSQQVSKPFILRNIPLIRLETIRLSDDTYIFILVVHHCICDGWSIENLIKELFGFYQAYSFGETPEMEALRIQYKDFTIWQNNLFQSEDFLKHEQYFIQNLQQAPVLELKTDYQRPPVKKFEGGKVTKNIGLELSNQINRLAEQKGGSVFIIMAALYKAMLARYTNQTDIVIGSPIAGREHADLHNQIGNYVNTLPIRTIFNTEVSFDELVDLVKESVIDAQVHQQYPFDLMVEKLGADTDKSRTPIFSAGFSWHNYSLDYDAPNWGFDVEFFDSGYSVCQADIWMHGSNAENGSITIAFDYDKALFSEQRIERMLSHFLLFIDKLTKYSSAKVFETAFISDEEQAKLFEWGKVSSQESYTGNVVALFEKQAAISPESLAVIDESNSLSYHQLDTFANQLANHLIDEYKVVNEDRIGILMTRNTWMITSMLGTLKAGCVYVPLDAKYPIERLDFIIKDANIKVLLTDVEHFDLAYQLLETAIYAVDIQLTADSKSIVAPQKALNSQNLAYIMYTSGSTGTPKGVMIEHRGIIRLVQNPDYVSFEANDKLLLSGAITFDATTFEIWGMLLNGGQLHLVSQDTLLSAARLKQAIEDRQITTMWMTVALFNQMVDTDITVLANLQKLLVGGDKLSAYHINQVLDNYPHIAICNGYGPTENTTFSACYKITQKFDNNIPIGKPINGSTAYILSDDFALTPIGIDGTLFVGGDGLARGYLNQSELTATKFITNPYNPTEKLYNTGDIVYWNENGLLEYVGRKDGQLKIRGFRVEIGEIEANIQQFAKVKQVVVLAVSEENEKNLCAYYTSTDDCTAIEVKKFLQGQLPSHMIPKYWVVVSEMPLTHNGKIDKKKLEELPLENITNERFELPQNQTEQQLVEVWKEVLNLNEISVIDNFFELGGHSLKATRLVQLIWKQLNAKIELSDVFQYSTIRELALIVSNTQSAQYISIPKVQQKKYYQLSSAQYRMWLLQQSQAGNFAYNMAFAYTLRGNLDEENFCQAWRNLVKRHEILRTNFIQNQEGIFQQVKTCEETDFRVVFNDVAELSNTELEARINQESKTVFNLSTDNLLKVNVFKVSENQSIISLVMHHIISDGWSLGVIIKEVFDSYNALAEAREQKVHELPIQYKDYAAWQIEQLAHDTSSKDYWLGQFMGEIPNTKLPTDKQNVQKNKEGETQVLSLESQISDSIKDLAQSLGVSEYMVFLAGLNVLLNKYTGDTDFTIGCATAGRSHADLEHQIGFYVNTLAFRNSFTSDFSLSKLLDVVKKTTLDGYQNQDYPYDELISELAKNGGLSQASLFNVMLTYQSAGETIDQLELHNLEISRFGGVEVTNKFDWDIDIQQQNNQMMIVVNYDKNQFTYAKMSAMLKHYENALWHFTQDLSTQIKNVTILDKTEQSQLTRWSEGVVVNRPETLNLINLLSDSCLNHTQKIALSLGDTQVTYAELWEQSNQIANYLKLQGIDRECGVALLMNRSVEMIIGLLGILKTGAFYVPIDPEIPKERIQYLIEDAKVEAVLHNDDLLVSSNNIENILLINITDNGVRNASKNSSSVQVHTKDIAYVLYTSGSTGLPKGVEISHASLVDYVLSFAEYFQVTEADKFIQQASLSFDTSIEEIFPVLLHGGQVEIIKNGGKDIEAILQAINKGATILSTTPMVLSEINKEVALGKNKLRAIISGGDELHYSQINHLINQVKVYNTYGPTESTVCATYAEVLTDEITIGKPLTNRQVYILNNDLQLQPTGVNGEIYIGGNGLAKGYYQRPMLTNERFIYRNGVRLYKSGDFGKWTSEGTIDFLGRQDNQTKIRGYRVEIEEIEKTIQQIAGVQNVVVVIKNDTQEKYLAAFYEGSISREELRLSLHQLLPNYMVPRYLSNQDKLPLTTSGKVDRQRVAQIETVEQTSNQDFANIYEAEIAEVWREVLEKESVSATENFFEAGGHSLKASRFVQKLWKKLGLKLEIFEVFQYPTIRELANCLQTKQSDSYKNIDITEQQESYPVSSAQKRMWLLQKLDPNNYAYNMAFACEITGELDEQFFAIAWQQLVERHEILRTKFEQEKGEIRQRIIPIEVCLFGVENQNATGLSPAEIEQQVYGFSKTIFDLSSGELLKVKIWQLSSTKRVIAIVMHHIISDGTSMDVMVSETFDTYNNLVNNIKSSRQPLRIQYKDYAAWEQNEIQNSSFTIHQKYWLDQFEGELPVLKLPLDGERTLTKSYAGKQVSLSLGQQLSADIRSFAKTMQVSEYMLMLGALKVLLYRYTSEKDLIVGCPIAGRQNTDLENQIGFYVNTLALRTRLNDDWKVNELLENIKQTTLQAYQHQIYPFDNLVEELGLERDTSRSVLFDVMLSMQNTETQKDAGVAMNGIEISGFGGSAVSSKFDWDIDVQFINNEIKIITTYDTQLFNEQRMERMLGHLQNILRAFINNPSQAINQVSLLGESETQEILRWSEGDNQAFINEQSLVDILKDKALTYNKNIAITDSNETWTYQNLWETSNQVAHKLTSLTINSEERVGVFLPRTNWLLAGVMGIMKAGAAYVPLDRNYPIERLQYIVETAQISKILVEQEGILQEYGFRNVEEIILNSSQLSSFSNEDLPIKIKPDQLAYILFTSGSTGQPKGVEIEHRNVVAFLEWCLAEFDSAAFDVLVAVTSLNFDLSVYELFFPQLSGKTISMVESGLSLIDYLPSSKTNKLLVNTVPSVIETLLRSEVDLSKISVLNMAGEPIGKFIQEHLPYQTMEVRNLYGPTEDTTYSTGFRISNPQDSKKIGKSKKYSQAYILGVGDTLQPVGVLGEICLSGAGLARGYHQRPDLTQEKFVPHPLRPNTKMYRTGDLGFWDWQGELVCIGRKDTQVKLRGYRIELGEIEQKAEKLAHVEQAVAIIDGENENKKLILFYQSTEVEESVLQKHLEATLPTWMLPEQIICLANFPQTPNGKIDKIKLRSLVQDSEYGAIQEIADETEFHLKAIWEQELQRENISLKDNFFKIGGHSLKAIRVISKIRQKWNIDLPLKTIFIAPTISQLANEIKSSGGSLNSIDILPTADFYEVSHGQNVWLTKYRYAKNRLAFNMHLQTTIKDFNDVAFENALDVLVSKHELLRSTYEWQHNRFVQRIHTSKNFKKQVSYIDVRYSENPFELISNHTQERISKPFDLEKGPLFEVQLFRISNQDYCIAFTIEHVISDAWSLAILKDEFTKLYDAFCSNDAINIETPATQYNDFAAWHRMNLTDESEKAFWANKVGNISRESSISEVLSQKDSIGVLSYRDFISAEIDAHFVPIDTDTKQSIYGKVFSVRPLDGAAYQTIIKDELYAGLKGLSKNTNASFLSVLSSSLALLVNAYTQQKEVFIGTPVSLRGNKQLDSIFGWLLDTLLIKHSINHQFTVNEFIQQANAEMLEVYEHRFYPFEKILADNDVSIDALGSVFLHLINSDSDQEILPEGTYFPNHLSTGTPTFNLNFTFKEYHNCMVLTLDYRNELFQPWVIETLVEKYFEVLHFMIQSPNTLHRLSINNQVSSLNL